MHYHASWNTPGHLGDTPACFATRDEAVDYLCSELGRVGDMIGEETGLGVYDHFTSADSAIDALREGADQAESDEQVYWIMETNDDCPDQSDMRNRP